MSYWEWYEEFKKSGTDIFEFDGEIVWEACKQEVLKILKQDWTGLDLSINSCDDYYIDKIKML
jgi:hypothetical protein